jgi:ribosomal protein L31
VRQGIHPKCGDVAFRERSTGRVFLTRSMLASRPAVDSEGRVEKFERRHGRKP